MRDNLHQLPARLQAPDPEPVSEDGVVPRCVECGGVLNQSYLFGSTTMRELMAQNAARRST
jgi:hypothetical protein